MTRRPQGEHNLTLETLTLPMPLGLKILFIEDHDEIREALASVLESEGFEVTTGCSAEEGLAALQRGRFDLVLSDYSLPENTGAWMIQEAARAGWMTDTQSVLVTAHPNPEGAENIRIVRKPLDLDDFLREVHQLLAPARKRQLDREQQAFSELTVPGTSPHHVELALYISASSPASLRALRNLQRLLKGYSPARVALTVHDLSKTSVAAAEEDRIAFTPTLVKRQPGPKTWIVGDLEDGSAVEDLLGHLELEQTS